MKSDRRTIDRLIETPNPATRFYLFYGYDEGQSRAYAERLVAALGAEKVEIAPGAVKGDPAILADEAAAIDMFGGARAIWLDGAGDEIAPAVEALLGAQASESPVIAVAGGLRKTSALLKLAEAHPLALAHVSYELNQRDTERLVEELARGEGLRLAPGVAARIATSAGNDRAVIAQELAKFALYLDASPQQPKDMDSGVLDEIGAGDEGEWGSLGDAALAGEIAGLADELIRAPAGAEPVPVIRAIQRRLLMLAKLRARVERGERPDDAMASMGKALFFKDKDLFRRLLRSWDAAAVARLGERVGSLERSLMRGDSPPPVEALGEELIAIARAARR